MAYSSVARDSRLVPLGAVRERETPAISLRLKDKRPDQSAEAFVVYLWVGEVSPSHLSRGKPTECETARARSISRTAQSVLIPRWGSVGDPDTNGEKAAA